MRCSESTDKAPCLAKIPWRWGEGRSIWNRLCHKHYFNRYFLTFSKQSNLYLKWNSVVAVYQLFGKEDGCWEPGLSLGLALLPAHPSQIFYVSGISSFLGSAMKLQPHSNSSRNCPIGDSWKGCQQPCPTLIGIWGLPWSCWRFTWLATLAFCIPVKPESQGC